MSCCCAQRTCMWFIFASSWCRCCPMDKSTIVSAWTKRRTSWISSSQLAWTQRRPPNSDEIGVKHRETWHNLTQAESHISIYFLHAHKKITDIDTCFCNSLVYSLFHLPHIDRDRRGVSWSTGACSGASPWSPPTLPPPWRFMVTLAMLATLLVSLRF